MEDKKIISKHGLDFVIIGSIFLVFFLCPIFFTGLVVQSLSFEKMILFYFLVLLGVVAWVTKAVIVGELNLKRTPLDWPIVATLAIFVTSTILSISQKDSLIGSYGNSTKSLAAAIIFALFYYLVINNIDQKRIKIIFWGFVSSTSLLAVYSLLQLLGKFILPLASTKVISFNPLGSLSSLTMYLVITLPLLVIAMSQIKEIHPNLKKMTQLTIKSVLGAVILLALFVLTLLNGFTFWPAAIVGVVIILMFLLSKIIKISSSDMVIPIATFLLLIILLVLGNFNIMNLNLPTEVSLSRQASWGIAKASLMENPIFGSGPSTFYYSFAKYKGTNFNASPLWNASFDNPSGYLFETMATVGALGTLAIMVIFLIALSIIFLTLIKAGKNETQPILLALFSSFITVIIFSLLFALGGSLVLISILVAVLAVAVAIINYPEKFKTLNLSFRASPKYALALAAIFLSLSAGVVIIFTLGIKMYLADFYIMRSLNNSDINQQIDLINKAIVLAPYQDAYYINLANSYMALANKEATSGAKNQNVVENSLALAISQGKKALEISPNNVANTEAMALIYENASFYVRGALDWAENLYNKAIELDPDSPTPYVRLALIDMARANAEKDKTQQEYYINEAIKQYDAAIAKKGDLGAAYYGKAIAYEKLNKIDDAIDQLKKAVISTNTNADYQFELGRLYFNRGVAGSSLSQNASENITAGTASGQNLSVESQAGDKVNKNDDLKTAEQLFLGLVQANPNNANALYSLGLLYQRTGETDNAKLVVGQLLKVVTDQPSIDAIKKQFTGLY